MKIDLNKSEKLSKVKYLKIFPLIFIGIAFTVLITKMSKLDNIINVMQQMSIWIVIAAVIAQILSYVGNGFMLKSLMELGHHKLSVWRGALTIMAAASIGLVGGWVSSAATTYYLLSKEDDTSGAAFLTGVMPAIYNSAVLIVITIIGMMYLLINHDLSNQQITIYGIILFTSITTMTAALTIFHYWDKTENFVLNLVKRIMVLLKYDYEIEDLKEMVEKLFRGKQLLGKYDWIKSLVGFLANVIFDIVTLYLFFAAAGYSIKLSVLIAGYSIAFLIGKGTFFVPGGAGVIEGGMTAIYINLNVPSHVCVVAVLGYRFISFWLPSLLGFAAMAYLKKRN